MIARPDASSLARLIGQCTLVDQRRLRARLRDIERRGKSWRAPARHPALRGRPRSSGSPVNPAQDELDRLAAEVEQAVARRVARAEKLPKPAFPAELPVVARKDEIAAAIAANQVVVVCGETGSGKTTQLPKICLELGRGVIGLIGHTQPRRIAARTVATRIAQELGQPLGQAVGYKVRFHDRTGVDGYVKVMTDGILLAETQQDRLLEQYDTLIIDEAHERSLNIDFLLGYLRQLLPRRPDLKVVITSATIDPARFAAHFATRAEGGTMRVEGEEERKPAPVIEVSGRTFPVEVRYRPPAGGEEVDEEGAALAEDTEASMERAIVDAVDELASLPASPTASDAGNILVFLPGEREIRETAELLRKHHVKGDRRGGHETEVVPLFARLSADEQMRAFQPLPGGVKRRIVLATNVAETSLTVPGVRAVIDTGVARISRYSARRRVQSLPIEPISRASAQQRAGRCGRVAEGVCVRLYAEEDFNARPGFTDPEILRTNLAAVILQMKSLRLGDPAQFPFIDPPDPRLLHAGFEALRELGALDEKGELTKLGAQMARLPLDPRLSRMILAAEAEGALAETLVIAAALAVQDPRERPADKQDKADQLHARFRDERSDFTALLNLWQYYHEKAQHLSGSKLRRLCKEEFISFMRMREWIDTHQQLKSLVTEMGRRMNEKPAEHDALHRAILAGLLDSVGKLGEQHEYTGPRNLKFFIFPGSGLFKARPRWMMSAEIVKTTRLYARTVAKIEPGWIERVGGHLVKRAYSDPHWSADRGLVLAYERVTLHGLEVMAGRRIHYGPIDPKYSRELFIQQALVEGELRSDAAFLRHNKGLIEGVRGLEAKARRHDLLADPRVLLAFYDARVPADVFSGGRFEQWRKDVERESPRLLYFEPKDVMTEEAAQIRFEDFPDEAVFELGGGEALRAPLTYTFELASPADGVTATVPLVALSKLPEARADWVVPGLVREKVTALIKALPKEARRSFVPAPEFAARIAAEVPFGVGDFYEETAKRLELVAKSDVPRGLWRAAEIPEHLRMNIRVVDEAGAELAQGRDLREIKRSLAGALARRLETIEDPRWKRDGVTSWDFGDLPVEAEVDAGGVKLRAHPGVVASRDGKSACLRLFTSLARAESEMFCGVRRLFYLANKEQLLFQVEQMKGLSDMALKFSRLGTGKELRAQLAERIAERSFMPDDVFPRTRKDFDRRMDDGWNRLTDAGAQAQRLAQQILDVRQRVELKLTTRFPEQWSATYADAGEQFMRLTPPDFLLSTPWRWLLHVPRYLRAIELRLERLPSGGAVKEDRRMAEAIPYWRACMEKLAQAKEAGEFDPALVELRWLVEELRVSVFAQELGTPAPVSPKRIEQVWMAVRG